MSIILIIDDNEAICSALGILLSLYELESVYAHTPAAGLEVLDTRNIELIIQDMNFTEDTTSGADAADPHEAPTSASRPTTAPIVRAGGRPGARAVAS